MASKKTEAQIEFKAVTSEFSNGIKDMNSNIKTLTNELRLNSTQLKGNADDVDLLRQRQNLLQSELDASSQKVELTSRSLEEAERLLGRNSTEYKSLYNQLINAKNQEQAIKNEIDATNDKLKQHENSLDNVKDSLSKVDTALNETKDGFTITKGVLADLTSSGIQSVVSGVGNLASSLYDSVEATEEYRSMMSKLQASTESFGYSTEFSTEKFDTFYKYLGDNQMATNAVTNLMGLQTSQESLTALTNAAIGVWSAYGDSIPIESLTESMNETAQVGQVTGVLADALNWAGISEDNFNTKLANANTTQERAELIANTLNGVYGESKAKYDELSGSLINANEAQNNLQQSQANLAETVSPLKDRITELKTQGFDAIKPVVESVVNGLLSFTNWITENQTTLGILATLITGIATAVGVYNGVMAICNAVMLASPITWLVAGIGALIAIIVLLCQNWDTVKQKAGELKDWVVEKFTELKDGVVNKFTELKDGVVKKITDLKNGAVQKVTDIKNGIVNKFTELKNGAVQKVTDIKNGIVNKFTELKDGAVQKVTDLKNGAVQKVTDLKNGAINIVNNIKNGIVDKFNSAKNTVVGIFDKIKNGITDKIEGAKNKVKEIIDKIKGFFDFDFKLPDIKMPHFSIRPIGWSIGDLLDGVIPRLNIEWRKDGAIFTKPTLFNSNRGLQGVGEAGAEAVLPINLLESYINNAFYNSAMQSQMYNAEQTNKIVEAIERLENMGFYVDSQKLATATANANDQVNGTRVNLRSRGVTLK